jgi:predicted kinase
MARIIIVTGYLATLKSTIASRLSHDLGILCIQKDKLKEVLGEQIGFKDRCENLKLSAAAFELIYYLVQQHVLLGLDLIVESNFKASELSKLQKLLNHEHQVVTICLDGDAEVLYERYLQRYPMRAAVHNSTGIIDFLTFKQGKINDQPITGIGHTIQLDTSKFDDNDYQQLVLQIKQMLVISHQ